MKFAKHQPSSCNCHKALFQTNANFETGKILGDNFWKLEKNLSKSLSRKEIGQLCYTNTKRMYNLYV